RWQKTRYTNLVRYEPSGTYFARVRIGGKLFRESLDTKSVAVAKMKLNDFIKEKQRTSESQEQIAQGKLTFADAFKTWHARRANDPNLKPRTGDYYNERVIALRKSWPDLDKTDLRKITKTACLNWAAQWDKEGSASAFNHTLSVLRNAIEIGVEMGVRLDNPAKAVKRRKERGKHLQLPETQQFITFLFEIENSGSGWSKPCADLVRFLAYGGFRLSEAHAITWRDVDLENGRIHVRGNEITGTKNWERRHVPVIQEMKEMLVRLRLKNPDVAQDARVMKVRECQRAMDRAAIKVGMARITHHDLRHLFATRCIESGVDIPTVARWLGHKDGGALAMKTYGHLRDQHSANMAHLVRFEPSKNDITLKLLPSAAA
ncbi:MAG TPA: site-specific integrase, partial [Methylomirabilota bacterium]|nr:site-specific integrase [Methylomirabilota bacterium]